MSSIIEILKPGLFTTIQDLGRPGFQKYGVSVSGAMDFFSHRIANWLVGNEERAATLECTILGPSIRFLRDATIAITGADLSPRVDGAEIAMWQSHVVKQGSTLGFGECRLGCRAYVALAGGVEVPRVLGSRSTHTRTRLGGYEGRSLKKGDALSFCVGIGISSCSRRFQSPFCEKLLTSRTLRFLIGPNDNQFEPESIRAFQRDPYRVSTQSDRMGIRFEGKALIHRGHAETVSDAVPFGTIQVPSNGRPIVLAADRQTTGGYPKIGVVITADFPVLAQLRPGDEVRFHSINIEESLDILRSMEKALLGGCVP